MTLIARRQKLGQSRHEGKPESSLVTQPESQIERKSVKEVSYAELQQLRDKKKKYSLHFTITITSAPFFGFRLRVEPVMEEGQSAVRGTSPDGNE
jgi:hypothetical protein